MEIRFRHILFVVIILLCGTQAIGQEISDSLRIHFQQSKSLFNESVAGNSQFYGSLADLLEMAKRKDVEIVSITVYGAASPEGGIGYNKGLSKRRADRIASYIAEVGGGRISPEVIAVGRDWKGLLALAVADSELPSREATLDLLCRLAMPNDKESEDRMFAQLKALDGGKPYRYMYNRLFPELRKAGVKVVAVYRIDDLVSDSRALLEATFVEPAEIRISTGVDVMPEAYSPGGMRVIFYTRNGGEEIVRDFVGKKGGCVEIPSGVYDVVCFNNDTQRVKYNGADGFSSIAATTGVEQVGDVKAFRTPDYLCGGRMVAVEVEVKIGCEQIIVLPVAPMVCRYTYTVRGVKNLQNFSECVAVQRAMCSEYSVGGDNEIQESKADICFAMERNDDVITSWCYTFGAADCDVYKTILYIRTASGKMVKGEYDVTQQINSQKGHLKNVDIVIDTDLDLDKQGGSTGGFGFDPSVDEWGDIESDIIL